MKRNLGNLNPDVKFLIDENNPAEGSVTLRELDGKTSKENRVKSRAVRTEYENHVKRTVEYTDEDKATELFYDSIIVDWDGITDMKGKPIPCTKEMKVKLVMEDPEFSRLIHDFYAQLTSMSKTHAEEAAKN